MLRAVPERAFHSTLSFRVTMDVKVTEQEPACLALSYLASIAHKTAVLFPTARWPSRFLWAFCGQRNREVPGESKTAAWAAAVIAVHKKIRCLEKYSQISENTQASRDR